MMPYRNVCWTKEIFDDMHSVVYEDDVISTTTIGRGMNIVLDLGRNTTDKQPIELCPITNSKGGDNPNLCNCPTPAQNSAIRRWIRKEVVKKCKRKSKKQTEMLVHMN
jgi:hypothetical protein